MSGEAANIGVDTGTSPAAAMTNDEVVDRLKSFCPKMIENNPIIENIFFNFYILYI